MVYALQLVEVSPADGSPAGVLLCLGDAPLHLTPLAHAAVLVELARALTDALVGGRPMGVRLEAGYRAALTADGPTGLALSVRRPRGPTVLRRQPLHRGRTRDSVLTWLADAVARLPVGDRGREALEDAAARLKACPLGPRRQARAAPVAPVAFALAPVRLAPSRVGPALTAWLDLLEAALASPEHPVVPRQIPLESLDVALRVTRQGQALERQVIDADGLGLTTPVAASVYSLALAAAGLVSQQQGLDPQARAQLLVRGERLGRWAAALSHDRRAPTTPPSQPRPARQPAASALPVAGLFHLAYRRRWRVPTAGLQHAVLVGDAIHLTDAKGLSAVDRETGALRWRAPGWRGLGPLAAGLAMDGHGRLQRRDSTAEWCRPQLALPHRVTALPSGDWLLLHDEGLEVLDPLTGVSRWAAQSMRGRVLGATWGAGGVWSLSEDRILRRRATATGQIQVQVPLAGRPTLGPIAEQGLVWVVEERRGRQTLSAWDSDGRTRWVHALGEAALDRPRRVGALVVIPSGDLASPRLHALDAATGTPRWQAPLPGGPTPPRLAALGALVLAKALDGHTVAFRVEDGAVVWALPADDPEALVTHTPPPLACRGIALIAAATVRAVDPATGRVVHTLDSGGLLPDRIHVWPGGDVLLSERDGVALFKLEGHLALVS